MVKAVRLGVQGVVLKEMAPQSLVQCVGKFHAGEQWIERKSFGVALERMLKREVFMQQIAGTHTPREFEVIHMVAEGLRNKEIADRMFVGEGTVKVHLHNIFRKLQVNSRLELLRYVRDKSLI